MFCIRTVLLSILEFQTKKKSHLKSLGRFSFQRYMGFSLKLIFQNIQKLGVFLCFSSKTLFHKKLSNFDDFWIRYAYYEVFSFK